MREAGTSKWSANCWKGVEPWASRYAIMPRLRTRRSREDSATGHRLRGTGVLKNRRCKALRFEDAGIAVEAQHLSPQQVFVAVWHGDQLPAVALPRWLATAAQDVTGLGTDPDEGHERWFRAVEFAQINRVWPLEGVRVARDADAANDAPQTVGALGVAVGVPANEIFHAGPHHYAPRLHSALGGLRTRGGIIELHDLAIHDGLRQCRGGVLACGRGHAPVRKLV